MKKPTKIVLSLLLGGILLPSFVLPNANGQLTTEAEEGCIVKEFRENTFAPFRITLVGDPAIRNSIEDVHTDDGSRWHLDRAEFEDEDSPTVLNFYTESIDDWKWTIRQEYRIEAIDPRPVTVSYEANHVTFLTETFYRTGFDFCIVIHANVRQAPHIFTEEEILETADKIQEENFKVVGTQISALVKETTSAKNFTIVQNGFGIVLIIILIVTNTMQSRGTKQLKRGYNEERNHLSTTRANDQIRADQMQRDFEFFLKDTKDKNEGFMDYMKVNINSLLLDVNKIKESIPGLKNEYSDTFIGPLQPDDIIVDDEGYALEKRLYSPELGEVDKTPVFIETKPFAKDIDIKPFIPSVDQEECIHENPDYDEEHKQQYCKDCGAVLTSEEIAQSPLNKVKKLIGDNIEGVIPNKLKATVGYKKDEVPEDERDEVYYINYYHEKLDDYDDLIKEYEEQNERYEKEGKPMDIYYRLKALSVLIRTDEKFDSRRQDE